MKITAKVAGIAAAGAALVLMTPAAGHADTQPARSIVNHHSNLCLQVADGLNGAPATQGYCENGAKAQWKIERVSGNDFRIVNVLSGKCLEIADSRKDNGAPAQQWTCVNGVDTQLWRFDVMNDITPVINKNSGKFLEIDNSSIKPGARAQQWTEAVTAPGQQWRAPEVPAGRQAR
ncbi:RICIN domain-containing protein [Streptomyces albireticuli]|uniref:RICIN domain-containing protein n=1 Tax=Streptomyces albireticuli TaxID=1940 RepID=UPI0036A432A4